MSRSGSMIPAISLALGLATSLVFATACTTTPKTEPAGTPTAARDSAAYQFALQSAFGELERRDQARSPAQETANRAITDAKSSFIAKFKKTRRFEVLVYPKFLELPSQRKPSQIANIKYDEPVKYQFRIDRQGRCALGDELLSELTRMDCIQVEIRPMAADASGQFVRIFMSSEYRVYGLSYHEYDAEKKVVKSERKKLRWDPTEPLSSELLSLAKDVVPLDLPIYASNHLREAPERLSITRGARTGQTCDGMSFKYRNSYGSAVKADWCVGDPWPTVVETSRYLAVLESTEGGDF